MEKELLLAWIDERMGRLERLGKNGPITPGQAQIGRAILLELRDAIVEDAPITNE